MNARFSRPGFTIVELLIVIVVIGILAAIVIVAYAGVTDRSKYTKMQTDLKSMHKLVESYYAQHGKYPATTGANWVYSSDSPDAFIPGIVPTFTNTLPRMTVGTVTNGNCYIYKSDGNRYKLLRLGQGTSMSAYEKGAISEDMKDSTWVSWADRWGYWSPGAIAF